MTDRLWIFPAILSILLSLTVTLSFHWFSFILCIIWLFRVFRLKLHKVMVWSILVCIFIVITSNYIQQEVYQTNLEGHETTFIIYPDMTSIKVDGDRVRFEGTIQTNTFQEKIVLSHKISTESEKNSWLEQPLLTHFRVTGQLKEPSTQRNFHQFDYRDYLEKQNIYWELQSELIQPLQQSSLKKPRRAIITDIRHRIFTYIERRFQPKIATYIRMLLFADKRTFSEDVLQSYRALGILHLFSISGFHITYLVQLIRKLLLRIGITHERTNLILLFILPLYSLLAGLGVGVFRAVTQSILVLGSKLFSRPLDSLDAWSITLLISIMINPMQITQMSFQLSYLLSFLFILLSKQDWFREISRFKSSFLFSAIASLASIPILSHHFYEIPWITTFANLLFIPFFSRILFPGILLLFVLSFLIVNYPVFHFIEEGLVVLIESVETVLALFTNNINFSFVTGRLPYFILIILIVSIFFIIKRIELKRKPSVISVLGLLACLFYHQLSPVGYVLMLDVGQGDSILIKEPFTGKISLIDTGGQLQWSQIESWKEREKSFSIGKDITVPALKSLGISKIDRLYITHADADHSGEIKNIADQLPIREIATTENTFKNKAVFDQLMAHKKMKRILIQPAESIQLPTKKTLALHPTSDHVYKNKNNQSLVLYVTLGEDKWLFTGDIEKEAERDLLEAYPSLSVDYLKASHHGSNTSTTKEFVNHIQPKNALISAGVDNQFGHPHIDVIERLHNHSVSTYTTSEMGAIMVRYMRVPFTKKWLTDIQTVHKNR